MSDKLHNTRQIKLISKIMKLSEIKIDLYLPISRQLQPYFSGFNQTYIARPYLESSTSKLNASEPWRIYDDGFALVKRIEIQVHSTSKISAIRVRSEGGTFEEIQYTEKAKYNDNNSSFVWTIDRVVDVIELCDHNDLGKIISLKIIGRTVKDLDNLVQNLIQDYDDLSLESQTTEQDIKHQLTELRKIKKEVELLEAQKADHITNLEEISKLEQELRVSGEELKKQQSINEHQ